MLTVNESAINALEKLGKLRQSEMITEQEFSDAKLRILSGDAGGKAAAQGSPAEDPVDRYEDEWLLVPRKLPRALVAFCALVLLLGAAGSIYFYFSQQRAEQDRQTDAQNSAAAEERRIADTAAADRLAEQQALTEQQASEQRAAAEQQAARAQSVQADLEGAKAEHDLAEQSINQAWKLLSDATRQRLLPVQRAWIKKKTADCLLEAAAATTDPVGKESARLKCETKLTQDRYIWIKQYLDSDTNGASTETQYSPTPPQNVP